MSTTTVRPDLAKTLESEQLRAARANLVRLQADLADARTVANATETQRQAAQSTWDRATEAGVSHTQQEAERLSRLASDAAAAKAHIATLTQQIGECEAIIATDAAAARRQAGIVLAGQVWPPVVQHVAEAARAFLAALHEQEAVRQQLIEAGAWGMVAVEDLQIPGRHYDDLAPAISAWLREAERTGVVKPTKGNTR